MCTPLAVRNISTNDFIAHGCKALFVNRGFMILEKVLGVPQVAN
jgi:hypothetical protein